MPLDLDKLPMPTIWAEDRKGVWHHALATYPSHADTACGKKELRCVFFSTNPWQDSDFGRPEMCFRCHFGWSTGLHPEKTHD